MIPPRLLLLAILALPFAAETDVHASPWIVEEGEPRAEIVIAKQPTRSVKLAAKELQAFIERISGARLAIVTKPTETPVQMYVGESEHARAVGVTDLLPKNLESLVQRLRHLASR